MEGYILMTTVGRALISRNAAALRRGLAAVAMSLLPLAAPQVARATPLPSFTFSPSAPFTNELVTFSSTSTGVIEPQRWDLDGNRICDDALGPTAQRTFLTAGVYRITLCVNDGTDEATVTRRITI